MNAEIVGPGTGLILAVVAWSFTVGSVLVILLLDSGGLHPTQGDGVASCPHGEAWATVRGMADDDNRGRGQGVALGLVVVVILAAVATVALRGRLATEVADPSAEDLVPHDWGADIPPDVTDIAYGPELGCPAGQHDHTCGGSQELDIYFSRAGGERGTLVYFHGGGFMRGDKAPTNQLGNLKRQLDRGFDLVSANYRLTDADAGENGFPEAMADVAAALNWVFEDGGAAGLSTDTVIVAGGSAGGTLAGLAGTTANSDEEYFADMPEVDGWISSAGIMTHEAGPASSAWIRYWTGPEFEELKDVAAVTNHLDWRDPPGYLAHGRDDDWVEIDNTGLLAEEIQLLARLLFWRLRGTLTVDLVDDFDTGDAMDENVGHSPLGGTNPTSMDEWIDEIAGSLPEPGDAAE